MTDEQFAELLKKAAERVNPKNMFEERAPFISFGMVLSVKREKHDKSPLCAYATVQIDFEALKAQLFSGDHLATLEEHLGQIEASLPYLRVVRFTREREGAGYLLSEATGCHGDSQLARRIQP